MTGFVNPLPGVPWVESPFRERLFHDADPEVRRLAEELDVNGFAVIDFPEPDLDRMAGEIRTSLEGRYDWEQWRRSGFAAGESLELQDAWQYEPNVRALAANARILDLLSALYGRRAWPFQTLNFPVGTQQHFRTDAVHFSSVPERFMCGVWVALEDIDADAGPLVYYPGSHKWPIYTNEHVGVCMSESEGKVGPPFYERMWRAMVERHGVEPCHLLPRKGQALIWAANLLHGGAPQKRSDVTRWSQVTHYYFEDCAYYTPMRSDPAYGRIWFRHETDIASGQRMRNRYLGHEVPQAFIDATLPLEKGLPWGFDGGRYLDANPDVKAAGMAAAEHWLLYGRFEGRPLRKI
jgi:hypothetical protein